MNLYMINLHDGFVGLMAAKSIAQARAWALTEHGTRNLASVAKATKEDADWIKSMGGAVPDLHGAE